MVIIKTYELLDENTIKIYSNTGVHDYCSDIAKSTITSGSDMIKLIDRLLYSFNLRVIIDDSVKSCEDLFCKCFNFNQPVTIPNGVESCDNMFFECLHFNQPINIPSSVKSCDCMFTYCRDFNQSVTIPDTVESCRAIFSYCEKLNQAVIISSNVVSCDSIFEGCYEFDQPVIIPANVRSCELLLYNCREFKQPLVMPGYTGFCKDLASYCNNLQNIIIIYKIDECSHDDIVSFSNILNTCSSYHIYETKYLAIFIPTSIKVLYNKIRLYPVLKEIMREYSKDVEEVLDTLIKFALDVKDNESYLYLIDYKNKHNMYESAEDYIKRKFSLNDNDLNSDNTGETNLF